jgi:hypothetical protein
LKRESVNLVKKKILDQLVYSEIFCHPLTRNEIAYAIDEEDIDSELAKLVEQDIILQEENYYTIFEFGSKIIERKIGNTKAQELLPKALKTANFISKFPFVEGVGISGSLSKGILMKNADFDFFIITKSNRLWVTRTMLILYKKIFLLNSRKYFCVNYFIDDEHLAIEEQNLFTATEIATLIPAKGEIFTQFYNENSWVANHRRTRSMDDLGNSKIKKPFFSRTIMAVLNNNFGEWLDKKFMQLTFYRWKKKFFDFDENKFDLTMKSRPYVSKHHPHDFQSKVLERYRELQIKLQNQYADVFETKES